MLSQRDYPRCFVVARTLFEVSDFEPNACSLRLQIAKPYFIQ